MLCFSNPTIDAGEPEVQREGKQECGGPWPILHGWGNETAYEKRPIQGKSLFSTSRNVRTKSLPRTWLGLKRGQGSINFTGSVAASCLCLSQEAAKAKRVEGLERGLDKFGEKQVTVKRRGPAAAAAQEGLWPLSAGSSAGTPVKASGLQSCFLCALLWASATGHHRRQDTGLDRPMVWPHRAVLMFLCLTKKYRCVVLTSR